MTCLNMDISRTCAFSMMLRIVRIQSLDLGKKVFLHIDDFGESEGVENTSQIINRSFITLTELLGICSCDDSP